MSTTSPILDAPLATIAARIRPLLGNRDTRSAATGWLASAVLVTCAAFSASPFRGPAPGSLVPALPAWCAALALVALVFQASQLKCARFRLHAPALAVGVVLAGAAWLLTTPWAFRSSAVVGAALVIYGVGRSELLRPCLPSLLLLAVPTVVAVAEPLASRGLQDVAGVYCETFYRNALGGTCVRQLDLIRLAISDSGGGSGSAAAALVVVAPECSGFRSLCGMSVVALLFAAHPALTTRRRIALCMAAAFTAFCLNLARLGVTMWLYRTGRAEFARGTSHALQSQMALVIGLALVFLLYKALLKSAPAGGAGDHTPEVSA
jgi:exosortase/archaeosortase family protein